MLYIRIRIVELLASCESTFHMRLKQIPDNDPKGDGLKPESISNIFQDARLHQQGYRDTYQPTAQGKAGDEN
jgi:hypothetical protein